MDPTHALPDAIATQPHVIVERDGVRYTLLGTAHVSRASVDAVRDAIATGAFDHVAVELDSARMQALVEPEAMARLDLVEVIRTGRTAMFAANLALAAYQRRLAEQLGIEPGAELKQAVIDARERGVPVSLIDRDVGLTFRRAAASLNWWQRIKLGSGLALSLVASEDVPEDEIEKLKEGDMLESSFAEFASHSPQLYETVIAERDRYMAAGLREAGSSDVRPANVLAVVGAGHLAGLSRELELQSDAPATVRAALEATPKKRKVPWFTLVITALLVGGVVWGFRHGGLALASGVLVQWFVATAVLAGLGALLAGGHPLSVLAGAIVAPFKPFRPAIPAGAVSALVEARLRKPTYADFISLREDVRTLRGWYRNRVARTLLVFILTNFGTMAGEWIAIARIVGKLSG
ncbi:TraB family protein [Lysobacter sp. TY2-98]|uniref:TraB/GumN family protein n=1 Tax=Lysobacter sp. TY2-98 TaxID=2290922 RepID=UPI000E1FD75E|nr:TraB/GumN family protein [Lysobacter sp. TY2-98]AXK71705.1 TraB family protein [Lysobacter sp. TY2-98]